MNIAHSCGPKRSLTVSAAEDFDRIRMECIDPLQYAYELIRPIVLFGESAAERSRQTGVDRTVIGDKARRFVTDGMSALADGRTQPATGEGPTYPEAIAGYILYLKQRYPPIHLREIERILARKFGYHTNHHTLKRFLKPYETTLAARTRLDHLFELWRCLSSQVDGGAHGPGGLEQNEHRRLSQTLSQACLQHS